MAFNFNILYISICLILINCYVVTVQCQLIRPDKMDLGVYNPETKKYEKKDPTSNLGRDDHDLIPHKSAPIIGGDDHDLQPHNKNAIGGDDHDYKPHTKVVIGGDDHDFKPHKKKNLGVDDHDHKLHKKKFLGNGKHDYKYHSKKFLGEGHHRYKHHNKKFIGGGDHDYKHHSKKLIGGGEHDYKPHHKIGGGDHDYKPHSKTMIGGGDHDYKPHGKTMIGGGDHDYKRHGKTMIGGGDHDYKPHGKTMIGGGDHDYKPHGKTVIGGGDHDYKPHGKVVIGGGDYDYKPHGKTVIGGGDHDHKPHGKTVIGGGDHDYKPHAKIVIGGGDHDYKPHGKKVIGGGDHDYKPHGKTVIGGGDHDYKPHSKKMIGGGDHDYKPHGKRMLGQGTHDYMAHPSMKQLRKDSKHLQLIGVFHDFVKNFNRTYKGHKEFLKRYNIFRRNMKKITTLQLNEKGTAKYGINKFADMSAFEFRTLLGLRPQLKSPVSIMKLAEIPDIEAPSEFDWRSKDVVTPVKNQGMCGSCWAFSVTGNVEGQWAIKYKSLFSLSEQELVDCDTTDQGCNGGMPENAYKAIEDLGGLETETGYPYEGKNDKCQLDSSKIKVKVNGSIELPQDEEDMKKWLYQNGPISIGINANALQFYMGGVSHPFRFLCNPEDLDHGMLIVGYGVHTTKYLQRKQPYWLIKNSWGEDWGEKGYYRVYRGDGTCGVNKMATSSVVP